MVNGTFEKAQELVEALTTVPRIADWPAFLWYAARRFWKDQCLAKAAGLGFDLLFALMPTIAIGFAILSAFPILDEVRIDFQAYIVNSFLPQHGPEIMALFDQFVGNTRTLTAFSLVVLVLTALLLFNTVDNVFNEIWRQTAVRPFIGRLVSFWAIMTALPLLVVGSVALSTLVARRVGAWDLDFPALSAVIVWMAPFLLLTVAFGLAYLWLPNRKVRFLHALIGGAAAALLFEALRWGFSLYIAAVPTFWIVYGPLASVPIVLLWIFLFWCLVLYGSEITAALPEWKNRADADSREGPASLRRLIAALLVMDRLLDARAKGSAVATASLAQAAAAGLGDPDLGGAQRVLDQLVGVKIIADADGMWRLARDPAVVSVADLAAALNIGYGRTGALDSLGAPWRDRLASLLGEIKSSEKELLSLSVEALLMSAPATRAAKPA